LTIEATRSVTATNDAAPVSPLARLFAAAFVTLASAAAIRR
jgi:hypothetical protein